MDQFEMMSMPQITQRLSSSLRCGDFQGWISFAAMEEVVASCELWPWSTDRFSVVIVIRSVDNNSTTVGHLFREFSHLLWHFLTHGAEIECGRWRRCPLIQGRLGIPCYIMLNRKKKFVVKVRDIISRKNKTEQNLPVQAITMVIYFKNSFSPWIKAN